MNIILSFSKKVLINLFSLFTLFVLAFSLLGINTYAQDRAEDPCEIAFCIGGFGNNPAYDNQNLTPGDRAFLIIADIAGFFTFIVNAIAIIFVVYGAFQMLTSLGDAEKFKKGRRSLMYAIVGMVISVVAYGVIASIIGFLNNTSI